MCASTTVEVSGNVLAADFALIIRAISVLEGIALVGDPQFAIVDEAYPFIAKLLLTDQSPRLQAALRYMVSPQGMLLYFQPFCNKTLFIIQDSQKLFSFIFVGLTSACNLPENARNLEMQVLTDFLQECCHDNRPPELGLTDK